LNILESIHGHEDLVKLDSAQRELLCRELREFLIDRVSKTGGHVASNLGVVELTVAIETVFNTEKDRLVFDVGHQSYIHKMLTGRRKEFDTLRQFGGMAGFPKPSESNTDAFVAGHASSSVSIALGMARARSMQHEDYHVVALIGDGAATGGMAYEGMNDAAVSNEPIIVILNDNAMSIDHNVGGMASHLSKLRTKQKYLGMKQRYRHFLTKIPGGRVIYTVTRSIKDSLRRMLIPTTIFENMGFTYFGPVDGHDTENLISLLQTAKTLRCPVLLHVMTQKGRGYIHAQEHPKLFHGIGKFDPDTGVPNTATGMTFSESFGRAMVALAEENEKICAITAAMPGGTGLLDFKKAYPGRLFDVGIAEEHAVSMAGGLAKQGMIPVVALYSTFLQRAYDMILQDVCMLGLHVVFAVDRAGLVGEDGETHHGIMDIGFLQHAPGLTILTPGSCEEILPMLRWAIYEQSGPVAIRYPRGGDKLYHASNWKSPKDCVISHRAGGDAVIITYGNLLKNALDAAELLRSQGKDVGVLQLLCVKPLPVDQIAKKLSGVNRVLIVEEACNGCGIREQLAWHLHRIDPMLRIDGIDLGNRYITHGSIDKLYTLCGMDAAGIAQRIQEVLDLES